MLVRFIHVGVEVIKNKDRNWHEEKDSESKGTWMRGN